MSIAKLAKFWDKQAESYAKSPIRNEELYNKKLKTTQGYFTPEMEILEFGCGTGTTAIHHAPHVNHILATDVSANMLEIARGKAEAAGLSNLSFKRATLDDLDEAEKRFDLIMGMNIIHLLPSKSEATAKVYSLLKPGGLFISSTPCLADSLWCLLWPVLKVARWFGLAPLVRMFGTKSLEKTVLEAGFVIERSEKLNGSFIVASKPAAGKREGTPIR
jgi:2-polyprenyl-3-methyl-5-hydroxy-6-metoxy-1,4-benzoquinol methylase